MSFFCTRMVLLGLLLAMAFVSETAVHADDTLVLGVFPRNNAAVTHERMSAVADYLTKQLNRPVELVTPKDFDTFWSGVQNQAYDIVHLNQYDYVEAHKLYNYDVILKNVEFGESTIAGAIIVRKDSGIEAISDLK